jgi:hypothetical protein
MENAGDTCASCTANCHFCFHIAVLDRAVLASSVHSRSSSAQEGELQASRQTTLAEAVEEVDHEMVPAHR